MATWISAPAWHRSKHSRRATSISSSARTLRRAVSISPTCRTSINFDVPIHAEDYVHRIGRTGRAGRSGTALTLVTRDDQKYVDSIERLIGNKIEWQGPRPDALGPGEEAPARRGRGQRPSAGRSGRHSAKRPDSFGEQPRAQGEQRSRPPQARDGENRPRDARPDERTKHQQPRQEGRPPAGSHHGEPRHSRRRDAHDPTPVGLGDHVPSFLLRPTRLPHAKRVEEEV